MKSIQAYPKQSVVFNSLFIAYWVCAAVFFKLFYGGYAVTTNETIAYTLIYLVIAFVSVDIHYRFITQPNLQKHEYKRFILFSIFLLIVAFWLEAMASFMLHFYFLDLSENHSFSQNRIFKTQVGGVNMIVFGGIALRFINETFLLIKQKEEKEKQRIESLLVLKEVELEQLKGQINPHFLFNSLNCIYGLSLEKSEQTPEVILRLSSILDYILYQCKENVSVSQEIELLKNYSSIQKERFGKLLEYTFNADIKTDRNIAPLLLFTLIENAFKHAKPNENDQILIDIKIICSDTMELKITNSIDQKSYSSERNGGLGLTNLKRRLELLYPLQHQFTCEENNNYFITSLKINFTDGNE